jgi:CRISPR-associated protein Csd1
MILQSLARYYEILTDDPHSGIAPFGYSPTNVSFTLNLSANGELLDIFPLFDIVPRGKQTVEVPRRMIVPQRVKRSSGVSTNFLCDNSAYVLGLADRDDAEYAQKRFQAFRVFNTDLLSGVDCPEARAVIAFLDAYEPQHGKDHPIIARHLEEILKGGNLVLKMDGSTGFVHDVPAIRHAWETYQSETKSQISSQCLVTGERAPIERLHPSLKGIAGANTSGATLVGFNARAYESYNRANGQGYNSPVSERAAFAYTTALNYLLSPENFNRKFILADTTVVYWAESPDPGYAFVFQGLFNPEYIDTDGAEAAQQTGRDSRALNRLFEIARKVKSGAPLDQNSILQGLDPATRFYVLGLAPNAARVSVRFFHADPFQNIVEKIMAHYADLEIVKEFDNQPTYLSIRQIIQETISKKSTDPKASPLLAGALFRSILENTPYPAGLYYALINRIRADVDDPQRRISKINYVRAAVIKAYLIRKYLRQSRNPFKEVLDMSLNDQSTIPAYVLGRLFAVLEKVQQEALGSLNASIKDRYFTSACATPASVFPVLLRLSQHHISKAKYGYASDRRIQELLDLLDIEHNPFPAHLSLDEQGVFILGYYHQRADFFKKDAGLVVEPTQTENQALSEQEITS